MSKITEMIDEVIKDLKKINEEGIYSNTIKALEKIKFEFQQSEKPDDTIQHDHNRDP